MSDAKQVVFLMATETGWLPVIGEAVQIENELFVLHSTTLGAWRVSCPKTGCKASESDNPERALWIARRKIKRVGIDGLNAVRNKATSAEIYTKLGPRPEMIA
jgi:hypothetical protein